MKGRKPANNVNWKKDSFRSLNALNNRLQLSRIPDDVLDDRAAGHEDVLLGPLPGRRLRARSLRLGREVYPAVAQDPAALLGELDDGALGVEEEEVLGVGDRQGRVRLLGAVGDFSADGADEDL